MSITDELREYIDRHEAPCLGMAMAAYLRAIADSIDAEHRAALGEHEDKALTYEEAKQLCMQAFDGGATYGSESMRYGVNARAYDWEHWLAKHESLFVPKPPDTWERIIEDALDGYHDTDFEALVARCRALASEPTP